MVFKTLTRQFGSKGMKYFSSYFSPLKDEVVKSNMNILFDLYVGRMLLASFISAVVAFIAMLFIFAFFGFSLLLFAPGSIALAVAVFFIVLTIYHSYPYQLLSSKKSNIEASMPFAINHMAAIASSGLPPFVMFKMLSNVPEYGEITNESRRIVRNTEIFGMDVITSIKNVANRTPSDSFRLFLTGITSTIETGGNIVKYLEETSKDALFEYRIKREKYMQVLSTYADIYTAVLIAAPLFFVSILSVMSLIFEGEIMGMSLPSLMQFGAYVLIPVLNIMFILFINYTQPKL